MAEITASMVKELREKTDAPMMECKKALAEAEGDMVKAEEILRVKLGNKAGKAASRIAAEGIATTYISADGKSGALIEVNGETDFVAKNDDFIAFTKALAQEVARKGVTVNTVSPGYIGTDMVRAIKPEVLEKIVATIPVKRLGTPEEIGSIVGWLAGEDSGFTTGADFSCNGGLHMG